MARVPQSQASSWWSDGRHGCTHCSAASLGLPAADIRMAGAGGEACGCWHGQGSHASSTCAGAAVPNPTAAHATSHCWSICNTTCIAARLVPFYIPFLPSLFAGCVPGKAAHQGEHRYVLVIYLLGYVLGYVLGSHRRGQPRIRTAKPSSIGCSMSCGCPQCNVFCCVVAPQFEKILNAFCQKKSVESNQGATG